MMHKNNIAWLTSVRSATILLIFTAIFTALMSGVYLLTKDDIAKSKRQKKIRLIGEVLPKNSYNNDLLENFFIVSGSEKDLGIAGQTTIYRAMLDNKITAIIVEANTKKGYGGNIRMILAVSPDLRLLATRIIDHAETPGLGDYIDARKDPQKDNLWINQFNNQYYKNSKTIWKIKKDGGRFDSRASATISARAVTNAIAQTLSFIEENQEAFFSMETIEIQFDKTQNQYLWITQKN